MEIVMRSATLFGQGGPVMYFILVCSILTATIAAERWLYYRTLRPVSADFMARLDDLLQRGALEDAAALCRAAENAAARAASVGIAYMTRSGGRLEAVLESEAALAAAQLRRNLGHLESIVTVAPLLGLLGTVVGMIDSFQVLNLKSGQPLAITGGIGEALIATAFGLCTAILAMAVHSYFSHQMEKWIMEMETVFAVLLRHAR